MQWTMKARKGELKFRVIKDGRPPKTFLTLYRKGKRFIPCWERQCYLARKVGK